MAKGEPSQLRSRIMASIKSSNTSIEKRVSEILVNLNVEFIPHPDQVYGKPDFIIPNGKVAIFCDGDFWHGFEMGNNPRLDVRNNREFWIKKITANIRRDEIVNDRLRTEGWKVVRLWEHEINGNPEYCRETIAKAMEGYP
jgi:DNA (cytosine-5)-methyltransferase 1